MVSKSANLHIMRKRSVRIKGHQVKTSSGNTLFEKYVYFENEHGEI